MQLDSKYSDITFMSQRESASPPELSRGEARTTKRGKALQTEITFVSNFGFCREVKGAPFIPLTSIAVLQKGTSVQSSDDLMRSEGRGQISYRGL